MIVLLLLYCCTYDYIRSADCSVLISCSGKAELESTCTVGGPHSVCQPGIKYGSYATVCCSKRPKRLTGCLCTAVRCSQLLLSVLLHYRVKDFLSFSVYTISSLRVDLLYVYGIYTNMVILEYSYDRTSL